MADDRGGRVALGYQRKRKEFEQIGVASGREEAREGADLLLVAARLLALLTFMTRPSPPTRGRRF